MKSERFGNLFVKLFALLLGLILLVPSGYKLYSYVIFRHQAVAVTGHVERAMQGRDIGGRPFIAYRDTEGKVHSFRSKAKTNWLSAPERGAEIKVLFLEDDPQKAIVDDMFYYVLFPLVFCIAGATFLYYAFTGRRNPGSESSQTGLGKPR